MVYIKIDKSKLLNLEYSLFREILRTNRAGSYSSTTIIGCNTRKYHGLLVCPIPEFNLERYVLLSNVDVSVIQHEKIFNLGIHKYQDNHYEPKGHKYIRDFESDGIPRLTYRVGEVVLSVELLLSEREEQVMLRYTLEEANSPTTLRFKPYLAFRSVHELTHQNLEADTRFYSVNNGIKLKMYDSLPTLNMQLSKENEFVPIPDWYKGIEYIKEQDRGYDFSEDLYVPGYFEVPIAKGESIIFSASTSEIKAPGLKAKFTRETSKRIPRDTLLNNLLNSAQQFIVKNKSVSELVAGYHWYGPRLRDTLISLPGLSLYQDDLSEYTDILQSTITRIKAIWLSETNQNQSLESSNIDVPLWLFYTLQEFICGCNENKVLQENQELLFEILNAYKHQRINGVQCLENGLLYVKESGVPLTWMDAVVNGKPVTPRYGMTVELNALWYNAIQFGLELARAAKKKSFIKEWEPFAESVKSSFMQEFWYEKGDYLYDFVDHQIKDSSIRPNQVFAVALKYSPLETEQQKMVVDIIKKELLTPKGLRSLSPQDPNYKGMIEPKPYSRDNALHQGCVWPWLFGFFAESYLRLHKQGGVSFIKRIMEGFEEEMSDHCLGTIPEFYTGTPPHTGKGAVSMAMNVGAIIKTIYLTENLTKL